MEIIELNSLEQQAEIAEYERIEEVNPYIFWGD